VEKSKWAVVFDFDGTLISPSYGSLCAVMDSSAEVAAECHNKAEEMRKYYLDRAANGRLTKRDQKKWLVDSIALYIESGLTLQKIEKVLSRVRLRDGVINCLESLHRKKVPVAVVSYGIYQFIDVVLRANGVRNFVDRIYSTDLIPDKSGLITGFSEDTFVFPFNKGKFSRDFADRHDVPYVNILAVGDSPSGDKKLGYLKKNRLGIAEDDQKKERLLSVMGSAVTTYDFRPVTRWIYETMYTEKLLDIIFCRQK
jgi:phosphoserine phosphatase